MSKNAMVELVLSEMQANNGWESRKGREVAHANIASRVRKVIRNADGTLNEGLIRRTNFEELYKKLVEDLDLAEAPGGLTSSAFPVIAGEMISSVIVDAYQSFPKNGLKLVRVVPSKRKVSQIAGWKAIGRLGRVNERENYPEVNPPTEKWFAINNVKHGGLLTLTRESLTFDQTNELIDRASQIGEEAARTQDEIILNTVTGRNADSYNPQGVATTLYSGGNGNLNTTNPLGTTGWETADQALTAQVDDNTGKPIWVFGDMPMMIVPVALKHTAWKLRNNDRGDLGTANLDRNPAQNAFDFIIDPYAAGGNTDWYYGSFKRQFRWEEIWPVETYTRVGQDTEEGFKADVIQQFKVSFYGGCGAVETRYVSKNTP